MNDVLGVDDFDYPGARSQIEYVADFIEAIPDSIFGSENVRVAAATYGQQEEAEMILDFTQTTKQEMKCLLYDNENCA